MPPNSRSISGNESRRLLLAQNSSSCSRWQRLVRWAMRLFDTSRVRRRGFESRPWIAVKSLKERYSSSRLGREESAVGGISVRRFAGRARRRREGKLSRPYCQYPRVSTWGGTLICVILFFPSHNSSNLFNESNPVISYHQSRTRGV
jgi:hypothetical protein